MQINKKTLEGLLALNDKQLMALASGLAAKSGIDLGDFCVDASDAASIRRALATVTDEDVERIVEQYKRATGSKGGRQ